MATVFTTRKSQPERLPIVRHIDEWERISRDHQNTALGQDWFDQVEGFYQLTDQGGPMPSFRPLVRVPELQVLALKEADDLSEMAPKPYVVNQRNGKRDKEREKGLQAEWRRANVNYHAMYTMLWALYAGMCPLQLGFDYNLRNGKGATWFKARDPRTFLPDPTTDYDLNWSYVIAIDRMHLEEIKARWPITSRGLNPKLLTGKMRSPGIGESGYGFQMPPGPMSTVPGMPANRQVPQDNRLTVRHVFCLDYSRELIEDKKLPPGAIVPTDLKWKWPNGRWIVECEGAVLSDGPNPFPFRKFPFIPFWATPPLYGIWSVPAIRFTMDMQNVAGRLYTGLFENATRLNNGVWFIDEKTGIDPNLFGGLPGEVQVINANSTPPTCVWPKEMPNHMTQLPQMLLDKQKELQGHGPARSGKPSQGNVSPELQDASVFREQGVTRLRARMAAQSFQLAAEMLFYTMARHMSDQYLPFKGAREIEPVLWNKLQNPEQYDVWLDEASVKMMSQTMVQRLAPELAKAGVLSARGTLEALEFPGAEEIAEQRERELGLQALGRVKGNKR